MKTRAIEFFTLVFPIFAVVATAQSAAPTVKMGGMMGSPGFGGVAAPGGTVAVGGLMMGGGMGMGGMIGSAPVTTNTHNFGIFLPREDVLSRTPEVENRIRAYLKSKPGDIPLAQDPLISDKDIVTYDWKTHTIDVEPSVAQRLRPPSPVWGTPFVVVADGQPVYVGAFYTMASSQSCPVPVILTDRILRGSGQLRIDRSYASPVPDPSATDPRTDARIKNSLQALGKLKE